MFSKRLCPKCKGVRFISGNFGDSNIMIDWCPSCHGLWLDKGEFQGIVQFLSEKLIKLSSAEMASKAYQEIKEIWNGTESKISEILDAKAAISTLIAITIFEHPALYKAITSFTKAARSIGLR
jgi:Zn-finger nucleic acid-binding protein